MNNTVIIKGNKYGIVVILDPNISFEELKDHITNKFNDSRDFFKDAKMGITFEGRNLTFDQEKEILDIIANNSDLNIVCVVDNDRKREELFKSSLEEKLMDLQNNSAQFYKGILRSGTSLDFEGSAIIIGDVNVGARVVSKGNIIVLGSLKGTAFAGADGNAKTFVIALDMQPSQIRIADSIARAPDKPVKGADRDTKIAFLEEGNIYIESLNKTTIQDINI
ncbi:MAG TPA: septum site-determining protein MinC [Clostridiales bacterium]|nr:septum site-determining protein MinC [Clostridiales bacterium]